MNKPPNEELNFRLPNSILQMNFASSICVILRNVGVKTGEKGEGFMLNHILLYVGSGVIFLWGIGHIIPTRSVVKDFGEISKDNKLIITMEWIAEGMTLCFIGILVALATIFGGLENEVTHIVIRASAVMLVVMAFLSSATGARTSILPMKLCPRVKAGVALLFVLGTALKWGG
jgi:hypothetical protein